MLVYGFFESKNRFKKRFARQSRFNIGLSPYKRICFIHLNKSLLNRVLFVLNIFNSILFGPMEKSILIRKIRLILKIYDVTAWLTNNYNTHIA